MRSAVQSCVPLPENQALTKKFASAFFLPLSVNFSLQGIEEGGGMGSVHLGVVELEGDGEGGFEEAFPVFSPDHEGVVENAAVHADGSV